jgi:hypothetical protein
MHARRLQGIARSTQDPGPFTVPSSTSPRHPRDGRPLPGHATTATTTAPIEPSPLRHRLRVLGTPQPSLNPIKERVEGSPREGEEKSTDVFLYFSDQHPTQHPIFTFETWDRFPLSHLVTPTQALRYKEIQYSPPSFAGCRAFFARTRINPRVLSLHHHPD